MLKRFMNWLLYRLQKALGAISGQRKGSRSRTALDLNPSLGDHQLDDHSQASISKSKSYPQSIVPLKVDDSEPSPFIEASQENRSQRMVDNVPPVNPANVEPDTHRRLNASSAALPGVETAVPSFPTDVSELLPSSVPAADLSADDEQLPEIHDLLPAVETSEQAADSLVDASNNNVEDISAPSSEIPDSDSDIVPKGTQTPLATTTTVDSIPLDENKSESTSSHASSTTNIDELPSQAVLFSFDIIESSNTKRENLSKESETFSLDQEDKSVQANTDTHSTPEDHRGTLSTGKTSTDERVASNDISDACVVQHNETEDTSLLSEADKPLEVTPDIDSSALNHPNVDPEDGSVESSRGLEPLPYPWSLAVSNQGSGQTAEASQKVDTVALSSEQEKLQDNKLVEPERTKLSESSLTIEMPEVVSKSGVVKLLFTLKPGNFHGYIVPNDGTQDILFHQKYINSDIFDCLERGAQVMVSVKYIEGKAYATNVDLL